MEKDATLNLVRSGLKVAGSIAVGAGYMSDSDAATVAGGIVALVGVVWSLIVTRRQAAAKTA